MDKTEALRRLNSIPVESKWLDVIETFYMGCDKFNVIPIDLNNGVVAILQGAYKGGLSIEDYRLQLCEAIPYLYSKEIVHMIQRNGYLSAAELDNLLHLKLKEGVCKK